MLISILVAFFISYQYIDVFFKTLFFFDFQYLGYKIILGIIIFFIINTAFDLVHIEKQTSSKIFLLLFVVLSLLFTLRPAPPFLLADQVKPGWNMNIMNLITDFTYSKYSKALLIGNIIVYIPIGYFVRKIIDDKFNNYKLFLGFVIYITIIEVVQFYFALGNFDIVDILLNTIGFCIGIGVKLIVSKKRKK